MMEDLRCCIVFACSGRRYAREALAAAARAADVMPELPRVGFADGDGAAIFAESGLFAEVHEIPDPAFSFIDKTRIDLPAHYDAALFLDSDTYLATRVDAVFALLTRFDLVVAHEPTRFSTDASFRQRLDDGAPRAFPELNTGVIGFRNTPAVARLFADWRADNAARVAAGQPPAHDQPAFRTALWASALRFYVLPPEYNFRFEMPSFIGGYSGVAILHGRGRRRPALAARLARPRGLPRAYTPWYWPVTGLQRLIRRHRRRLGLTRAALGRWRERVSGRGRGGRSADTPS